MLEELLRGLVPCPLLTPLDDLLLDVLLDDLLDTGPVRRGPPRDVFRTRQTEVAEFVWATQQRLGKRSFRIAVRVVAAERRLSERHVRKLCAWHWQQFNDAFLENSAEILREEEELAYHSKGDTE